MRDSHSSGLSASLSLLGKFHADEKTCPPPPSHTKINKRKRKKKTFKAICCWLSEGAQIRESHLPVCVHRLTCHQAECFPFSFSVSALCWGLAEDLWGQCQHWLVVPANTAMCPVNWGCPYLRVPWGLVRHGRAQFRGPFYPADNILSYIDALWMVIWGLKCFLGFLVH